MNEQSIQANPQIVISNLVQENSRLTHENAILKAILQEQNEQQNEQQQADNKAPTQNE
ncbi:hypothetical protein MUA77_10780 [Mammaliicoccus sciuri]|uniref:hypothetical protein n=1 Tax=Mammaliicoccus sciuri TaxID=1296 RepID=UPI0021D23549|nr:hypothetical protein [Mammaliicoccus sciuri]UXU83288.1 hypothetical protein MUA77_10780 [Mammaliicoccus sciuri]UXU93135.1 hypothetical protein MUA42_10790 [Mammaliicoccus sciuri]UXV15086.1 hypothetical protein MUA89_11060 [Mammaliicoccus sciuri]UXV23349.1 hypothetical protein MUA49_10790 [Mammaliicoccus sciuri]UXV26127.1 hypothetical protein MUA96_11045 [Mammaliicoccus sciuri]